VVENAILDPARPAREDTLHDGTCAGRRLTMQASTCSAPGEPHAGESVGSPAVQTTKATTW